jgi:hypothetical protein
VELGLIIGYKVPTNKLAGYRCVWFQPFLFIENTYNVRFTKSKARLMQVLPFMLKDIFYCPQEEINSQLF